MKKKLLWTLLLLLLISLTGCSKTKDDPAAKASKDYVYKEQRVELPESDGGISSLLRGGDQLYVYGYEWSENGEQAYGTFYELNEDGSIVSEHRFEQKDNKNYSFFNIDEEGNVYCIQNEYVLVDEETGEYSDDYYLVKMNLDGEEFFSVKLNDLPEIKTIIEENDYLYFDTLLLCEGKGLYAVAMGNAFKFDLDGSFVKKTELDPTQEIVNNASYIQLENGEIVAVIYEENGMTVASIDLESGTIGEKTPIAGVSYNYSYYAGVGYDLYLADTNGVYGYNLGDEDKTQLMNYVDSDLNIYNLYNVAGVSETEFFAMYGDDETGDTVLSRFTKVDPADVKDKKIITLAMGMSQWDVRNQVIKFNKSSEEYRINLLDYSTLYGTNEDYFAGVTRLNTDIASGNVPDIILVDDSMPADSYISKGLFEDLSPYIEKDSEIEMDNLSPNILEAYSVDGKLYSLVPSYSIRTLLAKSSDVGDESGWTVQEAMDLLASKPEGTQFLAETTRDAILQDCMNVAADQFIDWNTGKCSFDSEAFIQMLEFVNTFPEEIDESVFADDSYWDNYDSMWREGRVIAMMFTLSNFSSFNYSEKGTFGENVTIIGFPSEDGSGSAITPAIRLAMSAKSKNKEGVWEFMRLFLLDEYQKEITYEFPISLKRLDELAAEATKKPYYLDENNNKVEYDDTYYVGGIEIVIDPMTEQEAQELKDQILGFTHCYRENTDLLKIIQEEAAPYFAGQKKAKDVAAIIQSRAQIYVSENR